MSSRWDALKPRENDDDRRRGGFRKDPPQSSRRQTRGIGHDRRDWRPPDSSGRTSAGRQSNHVQRPSSRRSSGGIAAPIYQAKLSRKHNSKNDEGAADTHPKWDKLTRELWDWGKLSPADATQGNEESSNGEGNDSEILRILGALSSVLESESTTKEPNISPSQRGSALAAAFYALNCLNDNGTIQEVLVWSSSTFVSSKTSSGIRMTAIQAHKSIQGLLKLQSRVESDRTTKEKLLECCMHLVHCCSAQLPAEETAHQVVGQLILPAMEQDFHHTKSSGTTSNDLDSKSEWDLLLLGIQALRSLLQVKKQSSALLAPLVNDVSAEGREVYLDNQLRKRLFCLLQSGIQMKVTSESSALVVDLVEQMYRCLGTALEKASEVDRSTCLPSSSRPAIDLDTTVMEKFFKKKLQREAAQHRSTNRVPLQHRESILCLLLAFLKKQPDASPSIGSALLLPDSPGKTRDVNTIGVRPGSKSSPHCNNCGYDATTFPSSFLTDLHNCKNTDEAELGMASLTILVTRIPWNLWLGSNFTQIHRRASTTSFLQRVTDTIKDIVVVTKCLLVSRWNYRRLRASQTTDAIVDLVRATLLEVPYERLCDHSNQHQAIMIAASDLFETLSMKMVTRDRFLRPIVGRFAEVFEESMGGRITPQGTCTEMVVPARKWMSSSSSRSFLDALFDAVNEAIRTNTMDDAAKTSAKLLRAILRTHPETVLGSDTNWKAYKTIVQSFCGPSRTALHQTGLQLLEGLLQGRKYASSPVPKWRQGDVVGFVLDLVPNALDIGAGQCRCLALQAYGSMLGSDWFVEQSVCDLKHHADIMTLRCSAKEPVASVRSAACKALGDFCSHCFLPSEDGVVLTTVELQQRDEGLALIGQDVCAALVRATKDGNATVRSMAVFAIGNLAQVTSCSSTTCILDSAILKGACMAVFQCMADDNEKVAVNGIRSVGHLGAVILREDYTSSLRQIAWDVDEFCKQTACFLAQRIDQVPMSLVGDAKPPLSWKQRSTAKKNVRVACNTMALLLTTWPISDSSAGSIQTALCSVVNCVGCLGAPLDDKVLIAAMLVLRALPPSSLARVSGKKSLVGNALVSCTSFIAKESWNGPDSNSSSKLLEQVESLCQHLLESASIVDASVVIAGEEIADSMENLYEWMVTRNCAARAFDTFAIALQKPGICVPVTVEQKFANRAMNLLRHDDRADPDSEDEL